MNVELVSIGTTSHLKELGAYIGAILTTAHHNVRVVVRDGNSMGTVSVHGDRFPSERRQWLNLVGDVAHAVSLCIVDVFEVDLLTRMLTKRYQTLDGDARAAVLAGARVHLERGPYPRRVYRRARAALVADPLRQALADEGGVMVEGMLTFRLARYRALLEEALGQAVDDLLLEREYAEFIRLLRSFVAAQPTRTDRVDLVVRGANFRLLDREGRPMAVHEGRRVDLEGLEAAVNYEDVLISALIAAAPTRIVVHAAPAASAAHVDSVRRVFDTRVVRCAVHRCRLCASA